MTDWKTSLKVETTSTIAGDQKERCGHSAASNPAASREVFGQGCAACSPVPDADDRSDNGPGSFGKKRPAAQRRASLRLPGHECPHLTHRSGRSRNGRPRRSAPQRARRRAGDRIVAAGRSRSRRDRRRGRAGNHTARRFARDLDRRLSCSTSKRSSNAIRPQALAQLEDTAEPLLAGLTAARANVVLVAEETGWGVVPPSAQGRIFPRSPRPPRATHRPHRRAG